MSATTCTNLFQVISCTYNCNIPAGMRARLESHVQLSRRFTSAHVVMSATLRVAVCCSVLQCVAVCCSVRRRSRIKESIKHASMQTSLYNTYVHIYTHVCVWICVCVPSNMHQCKLHCALLMYRSLSLSLYICIIRLYFK